MGNVLIINVFVCKSNNTIFTKIFVLNMFKILQPCLNFYVFFYSLCPGSKQNMPLNYIERYHSHSERNHQLFFKFEKVNTLLTNEQHWIEGNLKPQPPNKILVKAQIS